MNYETLSWYKFLTDAHNFPLKICYTRLVNARNVFQKLRLRRVL